MFHNRFCAHVKTGTDRRDSGQGRLSSLRHEPAKENKHNELFVANGDVVQTSAMLMRARSAEGHPKQSGRLCFLISF